MKILKTFLIALYISTISLALASELKPIKKEKKKKSRLSLKLIALFSGLSTTVVVIVLINKSKENNNFNDSTISNHLDDTRVNNEPNDLNNEPNDPNISYIYHLKPYDENQDLHEKEKQKGSLSLVDGFYKGSQSLEDSAQIFPREMGSIIAQYLNDKKYQPKKIQKTLSLSHLTLDTTSQLKIWAQNVDSGKTVEMIVTSTDKEKKYKVTSKEYIYYPGAYQFYIKDPNSDNHYKVYAVRWTLKSEFIYSHWLRPTDAYLEDRNLNENGYHHRTTRDIFFTRKYFGSSDRPYSQTWNNDEILNDVAYITFLHLKKHRWFMSLPEVYVRDDIRFYCPNQHPCTPWSDRSKPSGSRGHDAGLRFHIFFPDDKDYFDF